MRNKLILSIINLTVLITMSGCSLFMTSGGTSIEPSIINMAEGEVNRLKYQYGVLDPNDPRMIRVAQTEQRLLLSVREYLKQRNKEKLLNNLRYEVIVLNSPIVDCYSVGAGKIVIFSGLLDHLNSEDEIAVMIGHTLAHEVMRHGYKKLNSPLLSQIGSTLIAGTVSEEDKYKQLYLSAFGITSSAFGGMKFSEKEELSADEVTLYWLAKSRYNPKATLTVLAKLEQMVRQGQKVTLLEIHPTSEHNRIFLTQYAERYFNEIFLPLVSSGQ